MILLLMKLIYSCNYVIIIHFKLHYLTLANTLLYKLYTLYNGARGGAVGWGTALQTGTSRVRFPMVSLEFFIDIIVLVALWPWGRLSL
jgi:hypothetical protein